MSKPSRIDALRLASISLVGCSLGLIGSRRDAQGISLHHQVLGPLGLGDDPCPAQVWSRIAPVYQGQYDPKALLNQSAARALNVEIHSAEVRAIRAALEAGAQQHPGALITVEDPLTMNCRIEIAEPTPMRRCARRPIP